MKNNNQIGQELSELTPVELVGCEDEETGSPDALASWVVHSDVRKRVITVEANTLEKRNPIQADGIEG